MQLKSTILVNLCLSFLLYASCTPAKIGISHKPSVVTASWYGPRFHGKKTANGEKFNMHALTAAHKNLPMNTLVRVTNIKSKKSVIVRINDRGPYHKNRSLDLSYAAAKRLGISGVEQVKLTVL
jgi:rare lipoprotein A